MEKEELAAADYRTAYKMVYKLYPVLAADIEGVLHEADSKDEVEFVRAMIESSMQHIIDTGKFANEKQKPKRKTKTGGSGKS